MLRESQSKQLSFYSSLYDKIPEKNILKVIDKAVDFSFVNELLANSYSSLTGDGSLSKIKEKHYSY